MRQSLEQQGSIVSEVVQAVRQEMEDSIRVQGQVMQSQCDELSRVMQAIKEETVDKPNQDDGMRVGGENRVHEDQSAEGDKELREYAVEADETPIQSDIGPVDGVDIKEDTVVETVGAVAEQLGDFTAEQLSR